jgi:DNA-binding PadR family transcriptional regulator
MLTLTVRPLERDGLVSRTVYASVPPRVDYELTELGRTLLIPLGILAEWAETHRDDIQRHATDMTAGRVINSTSALRRRAARSQSRPGWQLSGPRRRACDRYETRVF